MPNIVQLFYDSTGFSTVSGDPDFFSSQSIKDIYGPFGLTTLTNSGVSASVSWTDSSPTSGDTVKDAIISEFAGYLGDQKKDAWHIDPETGRPVNRHWEVARNMLLMNYGIQIGDRAVDIVPPRNIESRRAASDVMIANPSTDIVDYSDV